MILLARIEACLEVLHVHDCEFFPTINFHHQVIVYDYNYTLSELRHSVAVVCFMEVTKKESKLL